MDKTEKNLLVLVLVLLVATIALSSMPKPEAVTTPLIKPPTGGISRAPVIINPGTTASVMVLNNGAKAIVEVV